MKYFFSGATLWRVEETTSSHHFKDGNCHRCYQIFKFLMFHFDYYLLLQRYLLCLAWSGLLFASTGWLDCSTTLTRQTTSYALFLVFSRPVWMEVSLLVQIDIWKAILTLRTFSNALYVYRSKHVSKSRIKLAVSLFDFQIKSLTYKVTKHDVSKSETKLNIILNSLSLLTIFIRIHMWVVNLACDLSNIL